MRRLLTIKQVQTILNMGGTKLRGLIKSDPEFPAYLIGGRWKIDADKLDDWIERKRAGAGAVKHAPNKIKRVKPIKQAPKASIHKIYEVITPGWDRGANM